MEITSNERKDKLVFSTRFRYSENEIAIIQEMVRKHQINKSELLRLAIHLIADKYKE